MHARVHDGIVKEAIRNYLIELAPPGWEPPKMALLPLRIWTGMLYDGLAYGNWPWINFAIEPE